MADASNPGGSLSPAGAPVISVSDLTMQLKGQSSSRVPLIEDVAFEIYAGGSAALIGESGSGKTLTAMAILGLLPSSITVSGGSIMVGAYDVLRSKPREMQRLRGALVGSIFQDPMNSLDPTMTVGEHIAETRRIHLGERRRTATRHARRLMDQVGIPNASARMRAYPHEMSGGMQQRVMIAAAIACDPELLIADEPTSALDVTIQDNILELLQQLQDERRLAVLLVTHDLGVVAGFCEDVVVMYAGQVVERASVDDLFASPQHPYSKALLDSIPSSGQPRTKLPVIHGRVPSAGSFPAGCRFRPRCPYAVGRPCTDDQERVELSPGHHTLCARVASGALTMDTKTNGNDLQETSQEKGA